MATVDKIGRYKVTAGDVFFFDNNIWMFLFAPLSGSKQRQQDAYTALLRDIQTARATIFINALVVSEYINRNLRLSYELWKTRRLQSGSHFIDYKKDFRPTEEFAEAWADTCYQVRCIMKIAERRPDDFQALDIEHIFNSAGMDFNDSYYAEFCEKNHLILVTDDKDLLLATNDIMILTAQAT